MQALTSAKAGVAVKAIELDKGNLLVRLPNPDLQIKAADALRQSLGSDYVVALNLASTVPDWLRRSAPSRCCSASTCRAACTS